MGWLHCEIIIKKYMRTLFVGSTLLFVIINKVQGSNCKDLILQHCTGVQEIGGLGGKLPTQVWQDCIVSCRFLFSYLPNKYLMASYAPVAKSIHFSEFCMSIYEQSDSQVFKSGVYYFLPKTKTSLYVDIMNIGTPQLR